MVECRGIFHSVILWNEWQRWIVHLWYWQLSKRSKIQGKGEICWHNFGLVRDFGAGISFLYVERILGEAVDAGFCTQRLLLKMLNFINIHPQNDVIIFWPDRSSYHYTRWTREWLGQKITPKCHSGIIQINWVIIMLKGLRKRLEDQNE